MHFVIIAKHLVVVRSSAIPVDMSSMVRIVPWTNNANKRADDSRPIAVPWTHGLQSLNKQTASFLTRLATQAVRFATNKSIKLLGEQL